MTGDIIVVLVVAVALVFDFTNGFHDTANAMATTIATGALKPKVAVGIAAILNFAGAFISITVAATVAKGIVDAGVITTTAIFAGLVGAIAWNLATWWFGVPVVVLARADRRHDRRRRSPRSGSPRSRARACSRRSSCPALIAPVLAGVVALGATVIVYRLIQQLRRRAGGARLPLGAGRVLLDGRARARHQRRAEDDGRDLASR